MRSNPPPATKGKHTANFYMQFLMGKRRKKLFSDNFGALAQLARALALHAGGHRFDSDTLHQVEIILRI